MIRTAWIALGISFCAVTASAQEWAVKMFEQTTHDFGAVARGAKVEYAFVLENIYEEDVHIVSVRSSCGCTTPQIGPPLLKTWDKSEIRAVIDTRGFLGRKDATLTVTLDKPFPAEVQLHVHVFIRGDVVVQPGVVQLGNVTQGSGARQRVQISYAGRPDWRIERVECGNPNLTAAVTETERSPNGSVKYDLYVTLKETAPPGYIQDHLVLVTNDMAASSSRVPVPVEGIVESSVTIRPSPLMLGVVEPGQAATRTLIVQGRAPFRIVAATCDDPHFKVTAPTEAKVLHQLPVTFDGATAAGTLATKVHVQTDQPGSKNLEVVTQVQVVNR